MATRTQFPAGDTRGARPALQGTDPPTALPPEVLEAIRSLRYGTVEVTIHNGRVVQVERREKFRLTPDGPIHV